MKKWEYKVVYIKDTQDEQQLNSLGDVGWELVAVDFKSGRVTSSSGSTVSTFYLKRERT